MTPPCPAPSCPAPPRLQRPSRSAVPGFRPRKPALTPSCLGKRASLFSLLFGFALSVGPAQHPRLLHLLEPAASGQEKSLVAERLRLQQHRRCKRPSEPRREHRVLGRAPDLPSAASQWSIMARSRAPFLLFARAGERELRYWRSLAAMMYLLPCG